MLNHIFWICINTIQKSPFLPMIFRTFLLRLCGREIHRTSRIAPYCFIGNGNLIIGDGVYINVHGFLDGSAPIIIDQGVRIGPYVKILTGTHNYRNSVFRRKRYDGVLALPVHIKRGVWIGINCTILPGVVVAEGCVIAAGSLVVKSTDANGLYAGVPAKRIKTLSTEDDDVNDF